MDKLPISVNPVAAGWRSVLTELSLAIVVPVFNEEAVLPEWIVKAQQWGADELIVVDGGSTDHTCRLLADSHIRWISSILGRAAQMNAGFQECKSDIILFIHSDTIINSSHLLAVKQAMQDKSVVGGRFDVRLSGDGFAFRVIAYFINLRSRLSGISTGDQCQFVRRSVFERMGGFPEQALMEDIEFSKRLKRYGKIACLRQKVVTSSRRWESHGIIRTVLLMWKLRFLYWLGVSPEKLAQAYRQAR